MTNDKTQTEKIEKKVVTGTFNFVVDLKDLERIKKSPKCKAASILKSEFIKAIQSIELHTKK